MKRVPPSHPQKNHALRAQAIVELMLALPVLLMLLYGIIEVGRLIFIFSSVANASRQAVRYGAASGEINDVAFYQDCDGIRAVANQSAFIIPLQTLTQIPRWIHARSKCPSAMETASSSWSRLPMSQFSRSCQLNPWKLYLPARAHS